MDGDQLMDPTALAELSASTLSRLEQNRLRCVVLSNSTVPWAGSGRDTGHFWPNNDADLARLGAAIGGSDELRSLDFHMIDELDDDGSFIEGLRRNSSIYSLNFSESNLSHGLGAALWGHFVTNRRNHLKNLMIIDCTLPGGIGGDLSRCAALVKLYVSCTEIAASSVEELVQGIVGLHQLQDLHLHRYTGGIRGTLGRASYDAVAELLDHPRCSLLRLSLLDANAGGDFIAVIANALRTNNTLKELQLNVGDASAIANAFARALGNASTPYETFHSNHTLIKINCGIILPASVTELLEMNRVFSQAAVAIAKLERLHDLHINDAWSFMEGELKMLPHVLGHYDRAVNVDQIRLSAIFRFARAMPLAFVPAPTNATDIGRGRWTP